MVSISVESSMALVCIGNNCVISVFIFFCVSFFHLFFSFLLAVQWFERKVMVRSPAILLQATLYAGRPIHADVN